MSTDLKLGLAALTASAPAYTKADNYYHGRLDQVIEGGGAFARMLRKSGEFPLNYAHLPVDTRLDRIEVASLTVPESASLTDTVQSIWDYNDLLVEQKQLWQQALVFGDAFLLVWPDPDIDGVVNLTVSSPLTMRVIYSTENTRIPLFAIKQWKVSDSLTRANLFYADRIEKYSLNTSRGSFGSQAQDNWVVYTEDGDDGVVENPFGIIPVFHFSANGHPYGTPVHVNAYGPQDAITKANTTLMAATEVMGFPARYVLGGGAVGAMDDAGDGFFGATSTNMGLNNDLGDGTVNNRMPGPVDEDVSKLSSDPAMITFLQNAKSAGTFASASADNFKTTLDMQIKNMAQTTNTPMHYVDPSGDTPSGESLRAADAPLVKSVENLIAGFTRPLSRALAFALLCAGYQLAEVKVRFASVQSTDDESTWTVIQKKIDAGIPRDQALIQAGYTADEVAAWGVTTDSTPKSEGATTPFNPTVD